MIRRLQARSAQASWLESGNPWSMDTINRSLGGLRQLFECHRERRWILLRPLGNWGDHLIYAGAEFMARSLGIHWISCETDDFRKLETTANDCIYLHGGGGYNTWCSGRSLTNLGLALNRPVHCVVQGPVSVGDDLVWLAKQLSLANAQRRCDDYWFFAREMRTLSILQGISSQAHDAQVALDHDTALALNAEEVLAIAGVAAMPAGRYDLIVRREDNEMPEAETRDDCSFESAGRRTVLMDPALVASSFAHWVRIHLAARTIRTNRLHSAILGSVAGKPVLIGQGSYHKNASVWQHSLQERGVKWIDHLPRPRSRLWSLLPRRVRESYKVQRLRMAYQSVPLR